MKPTRPLLLVCCCGLALLALPTLAEASSESSPVASDADAAVAQASAVCPTIESMFGDAVPLSGCSVTVECDDGSMVSCNGNSSCSTSGTNNRCVTCDGVQEGCCAKTCCEQCEENLQECDSMHCPSEPGCTVCWNVYNYCLSQCEGGCP